MLLSFGTFPGVDSIKTFTTGIYNWSFFTIKIGNRCPHNKFSLRIINRQSPKNTTKSPQVKQVTPNKTTPINYKNNHPTCTTERPKSTNRIGEAPFTVKLHMHCPNCRSGKRQIRRYLSCSTVEKRYILAAKCWEKFRFKIFSKKNWSL